MMFALMIIASMVSIGVSQPLGLQYPDDFLPPASSFQNILEDENSNAAEPRNFLIPASNTDLVISAPSAEPDQKHFLSGFSFPALPSFSLPQISIPHISLPTKSSKFRQYPVQSQTQYNFPIENNENGYHYAAPLRLKYRSRS